MGVYNNNKDGTRSTIANTIQVVDAPMEQFVSRGEFSAVTPSDVSADNKLVAENEVTKAVDTMPTASSSLVGMIVQYIGTTTANYTNGYFYKCVSDGAVTPTYSWVEVISGGGGEKEIVHVTELPEESDIEDKIYELLGGIDTRSDVIEFPNSSQDIRSIEEYFNNRGYSETEEDEDLVWNVDWFPYYVETFVKDNKTYVLDQIYYLIDTQVYGIRYSDDTDQYWMEVQPSTTLTTQVKITHVEYFIGDSNTHNLVWIKDANYFAQDINSLRVENLFNVNVTDPLQNNSVLAYDSATNRWKNKPMTSVSVTQTLSSGTKIGSISVDGNETDLFAPSGSGGATSLSGLSDVQLSQSIGSGQALRYDSTSGKWINVPITPSVEPSQLTEITLEPNRFYILPEATELDISLNVNSSSLLFIQEFNFMFSSGSTPTELSLPSDVIVPDDFSVEANKIYEISIMNSLMLYSSWTVPEEEP